MRVALIDMGMGNLASVQQAFGRAGASVFIARSAPDVNAADLVVLPGVGAFPDGMKSLHGQGLVEPLRDRALKRGGAILGICLGMHLLADEGHEHGHHRGLGLIPGCVVRLESADPKLRIPNMGWCDVTIARSGGLFADKHQHEDRCYYFAHSYWLRCADPCDVAATLDFGAAIPAAVERGHIMSVQFHPEKSQDAGLELITSLLRHVGARCKSGVNKEHRAPATVS